VFCAHIRPIRIVRHFASMPTWPQPPCVFGFCRDDIGTRNVARFHMYHAIAIVNCRVHVVGAGNTRTVRLISLGGVLARNESVVRGLSSARMYPLPGLSPCLLRSPSSCSSSTRWYSRRGRLESLFQRVMLCSTYPWMYCILPPPLPSISKWSGELPWFFL